MKYATCFFIGAVIGSIVNDSISSALIGGFGVVLLFQVVSYVSRKLEDK